MTEQMEQPQEEAITAGMKLALAPVYIDPEDKTYRIYTDSITGMVVVDISDGERVPGLMYPWNRFLPGVLGRVIGSSRATQFAQKYPLSVIARNWETIKEWMAENVHSSYIEIDKRAGRELGGELAKVVADYNVEAEKRMAEKIEMGAIEFEDVPEVFKKGQHVAFYVGDHLSGGIIEKAEIKYAWSGAYAEFSVRVITTFSGVISEMITTTKMRPWSGLMDLAGLEVHRITDDQKAELAKRGKTYERFGGETAAYLAYKGQLTFTGWATQQYRADGRVIIDAKTFKNIDADQYRRVGWATGFAKGYDMDEDEGRQPGEFVLMEEDLWRTYPYVWGFSMACKTWGRLELSALTPIQWRSDAFDKLVMEPEDKELVHALVSANKDALFSDLIDGKGGGTIFLLHGPPGQGKTLTAESVAEVLKQPLYPVSIGELGTDPDVLEKRLRQILDMATVWNSVLLLDEADIFLEARDEHDVVRNAMVGVFLRLLEYHQGVLFLTTNRVRNIDEAFYSRISIALSFGEADTKKREKIWTNLLAAAQIENINVQDLGDYDLNGRQIKNVIRLSMTLARQKGEPLSLEIMERVIGLTTKFRSETVKPLHTLEPVEEKAREEARPG